MVPYFLQFESQRKTLWLIFGVSLIRRDLQVLPGFDRPPFLVVIPTYGRPDRLVRETLGFLRRQKIPQNLIERLSSCVFGWF